MRAIETDTQGPAIIVLVSQPNQLTRTKSQFIIHRWREVHLYAMNIERTRASRTRTDSGTMHPCWCNDGRCSESIVRRNGNIVRGKRTSGTRACGILHRLHRRHWQVLLRRLSFQSRSATDCTRSNGGRGASTSRSILTGRRTRSFWWANRSRRRLRSVVLEGVYWVSKRILVAGNR